MSETKNQNYEVKNCFVSSRHESFTNIPFHQIHYIYCNENGKLMIEIYNGFSYSITHFSHITINNIVEFTEYKFDIYEHQEFGKIIARENTAPGKAYFNDTLIICILEMIKNKWWKCFDYDNRNILLKSVALDELRVIKLF